MSIVKIVLVGLLSAVVLLLLTVGDLFSTTHWPSRSGSVAIDVALLPRLTLYSPIFWLILLAVGAIRWWSLRRWLFA